MGLNIFVLFKRYRPSEGIDGAETQRAMKSESVRDGLKQVAQKEKY